MHIAPSEAVHTHYAASLSLHSLRQRGMGPPKRSQVPKVLERAATHCAQEICDTPTPRQRGMGPPKRSQVPQVLERAATHCAQESCDTPTPAATHQPANSVARERETQGIRACTGLGRRELKISTACRSLHVRALEAANGKV